MLSARAATDPAASGPFTASQQSVGIPGMQGATLTTDVYFPSITPGNVDPAAAPCPVIVLGHGFSQSKAQHVNQGLHLATRGFIVLIPNFNAASDHSRNADELRKCLDWIEARHADAASIFFGKVRLARCGATGHSAGGLSAILAAARDARIRVLAPMDPVDNASLGVNALPGVNIPIAITHSEASSCNSSGSAETLAATAHAPKRVLKIIGANHTDPQDPAGFLSILTCGSANSARQTLYRRYLTGWFEYYLHGDLSYAPWIFNLPGGQLAVDLAAGKITDTESPAPLAAWKAVQFGPAAGDPAIAGNDADPDADGLRNLVEYGTGSDPFAPSALPVVSTIASHLALTFSRNSLATDLTLTVQGSDDSTTWLDLARSTTGSAFTPLVVGVNVSESGPGPLRTVEVRDLYLTTDSAHPRRFLRLLARP